MSGRRQDTFFCVPHTPKAAAYGTPVSDASIDKWYKAEDPVLFVPGGEEDHDEAEIKGTPSPTEGSSVTNLERFTATVKMKCNVDILPLLYMSGIGVVDTTGVGPYVHSSIEPGPIGTDAPLSFSVVVAGDRNVTTTFWRYDGVVVSNIKITQERGKPLMLEFTMHSDGSKTAVAGFTPPNSCETSPLRSETSRALSSSSLLSSIIRDPASHPLV